LTNGGVHYPIFVPEGNLSK